MTDPANCIVMRREGGKLQTRGPLAEPVTERQAIELARDLGRRYPAQQFVVLQEIASTQHQSFVAVRRSPPLAPVAAPAAKAVR